MRISEWASSGYLRHFHGGRRERLFLSSVSFFATFALVRALTNAIRLGIWPFGSVIGNIVVGGAHLHHLVWGILILLLVGYLWLVQADLRLGPDDPTLPDEQVEPDNWLPRPWVSRLTSILFGIGSALTLDEYALWLNLQDVYWEQEGRVSIDAVVLFGALLSAGLWGRPLFKDLIEDAPWLFGQFAPKKRGEARPIEPVPPSRKKSRPKTGETPSGKANRK